MKKTPPKPKAPSPADVEKFIGGAKTAVADSAPARGRKKKGLPAEGVVRATIDLPLSVHEELKIRGIQEKPRKTMKELVLAALEKTYGIKSKAPKRPAEFK